MGSRGRVQDRTGRLLILILIVILLGLGSWRLRVRLRLRLGRNHSALIQWQWGQGEGSSEILKTGLERVVMLGCTRKRPANKLPLPSSNTSCLTPLMNVNLGIWDKLTRLIVMLLLLAALLLIALWYLPLIQRNERMRKDNLTLDTEVKKEEETQKRLRTSIDVMRDPRTVERLARERLSYA